jgi:four helix bundle protein
MGDAKDQLNRAARSIVLNLAEGRGWVTAREQKRFFNISMGSLRESQAVLILENLTETEAWKTVDRLGAHLYRLIQHAE